MNFAYILALAASVFFGAADYAGGLAARRAPAMLVTCFSGFAGIAILALAMPFLPGVPTRGDLLWGVATGACGAAGATLIYRSLALGPVSLASPVFSLIGLAVPVLVGVVLGDRPSLVAWAGVALAGLSIPLLSWSGSGADAAQRAHLRRTLVAAIAAGLVIGWFLVCVSRIHAGAGLLPLVVARATAVAIFLVWFLARRLPLVPAPGARLMSLAAGALDSSANALFLFATHTGALALTGALVSLAPATSVLFARVHLRERWNAVQGSGLVLALIAGAMISLG